MVLVFRRLPDLEGVASTFKDILGCAIAICTSRRSARGLNFFLAPLLGKLLKLLLLDKDWWVIKEVIVVRGTLVLWKIWVGV
jgi:hypothetical protein